jgi:hypothetical protein
MDITRTVEPRSDQLNFDDVQAHDLTITITEVKQGPPDQPVELHNKEFPGRPYKPGKSMRRVLIAAWGVEASAYVGRSVRLYGDPTIKFGKDAVGGIRIRALSHITEPLTVPLTVTRGKRAPFTVQPLTTDKPAPKPDTAAVDSILNAIDQASSMPALKAAWDLAGAQGVQGHPDVVAAKDRRKAELTEPS